MAREIFTRDFILICFAQLVFTTVFFALMPTIPIYLSRQGIREAEIGVLVGVFIVASLVMKPFVGRALLRTPERKFLIAGSLVTAVCCIGYLVAPPFAPPRPRGSSGTRKQCTVDGGVVVEGGSVCESCPAPPAP